MIATFRPAAWLSADIRRNDGLRCRWRPAWIIEEGPWKGQRAWLPVGVRSGPPWAPDIELVEREHQ